MKKEKADSNGKKIWIGMLTLAREPLFFFLLKIITYGIK